jgi:hypothetical protein
MKESPLHPCQHVIPALVETHLNLIWKLHSSISRNEREDSTPYNSRLLAYGILQLQKHKLFDGIDVAQLLKCFLAWLVIDTDCHDSMLSGRFTTHTHERDVHIGFTQNGTHIPDHARLVNLSAENDAVFQTHINVELSNLRQIGYTILHFAFQGDVPAFFNSTCKLGLDMHNFHLRWYKTEEVKW